MRFRYIFPILHLYPSDTVQEYSIPAGMPGLRHKSRHKSDCPRELSRGYPPLRHMDAPARARFRKNKKMASAG